MTSKTVRGITIGKDGKVKKRPPRMAGHERKRLEGKAKREAAQWEKRSKSKTWKLE